MSRPLDISGVKFGRLKAVRYVRSLKGQRVWACDCECGNKVEARVADLRKGNTRSCGCLQKERAASAQIKHGLSSIPEYAIWKAMRHRCESEGNPDWDNYGGRGITVCDRWSDSFEAFLEDMGSRPFPEAQLDRENNDGNYEPGNCRWVTAKVNANNRRR